MYVLAWEVYERLACPKDPADGCAVSAEPGLRPCHECCHCHHEAQAIEDLLLAVHRAGREGVPEGEVAARVAPLLAKLT